ncbi:MAG TPA: hypothetical protein VNN80_23360 [Polyangiaceae bacterium]|nr:hypothetical protein [Polyangiaceae bacterium]
MHTGDEGLLLRYPGQKLCELRSLGLAQGRAERLLMLARHTPDALEQLLSRGAQMKLMRAPVALARAAFDEAALFQLVDHQDQAAREHAERVPQRSLAEPVRLMDRTQDPGFGRCEV